jgi:ATPase family associated with various cellular activities (AAA)
MIMSTDEQIPADANLLARGGGNATAAGVSFEAGVGAIFACQLLAERTLDRRLQLGNARVRSIRFETEAPLDDIVVETDAAGWIFGQVKTNLSLSENLGSPFGNTISQIVRQWRTCATGSGERGWDRSFISGRDRMLIAVGPDASGTITHDLAGALSALQAPSTAPLPQGLQQALDKTRTLVRQAGQQILGVALAAQDIDAVLQFVTIIQFDLDGPDRLAAIETLAHVTENTEEASAAFAAIERQCENLMARRRGTDAIDLRQALASAGVRLRATPSYQRDVDQLRASSARIQSHLTQYEETKIGDVHIKIDRDCTTAAVAAAKTESLVLVGEPGAGKSAVVSAAADQLRSEGSEVIELAVDRLLVESLDGLRIALGLEHGLREVLENWPGSEPAFLFIDALDATRGGRSEAIFRALITDVLDIPEGRWRVVTSIRTFDLRLGEQFKSLFQGTPPSNQYRDPAFPNVRHIHVPRWSDAELAEVLEKAPAMATALGRAGERLRDLARVPFNTRLLADLIGGGLSPDAFGDVGMQVQLLALYWRHRVERYGSGAELCLRAAVAQMVTRRSLQADRLDVAQSDPIALDNLRSSNVLITVSGDRYVSFPHHILFDYAASRVFIDPADIAATGDLLRRDRGLGLMLAPALSYALQDLWVAGQNGHPQFWRAIIHFAGDGASDPIARSVAARGACELPATPQDMRGFVNLFSGAPVEKALAFRAFSHVVGALTVRIEDGLTVQLTPWCYLASEASTYIAELAWPLRTLLYLLVERVSMPEQLELLGQAARQLLQFSLGHSDPISQLVSASIGFVADTYGSDPVTSRQSLERLLAPDRLRDHAHEDMPWLARKVLTIGTFDPAFVPEIYKTVFSHGVTDDQPTSLGDSRILPLRSNRRQDYEMAKWSLKQAFSSFLQAHPIEGVRALIGALESDVSRRRPLDQAAQEIIVYVGSRVARLVDDRSHIWAWNPDDAHSDNAIGLVQAFSSRLRDAPNDEALQIANEAMDSNRLAILWSRMFRASATRTDSLARLLWPFAIQKPFLLSHDTRKDAIDLIAARYSVEPAPAREAFEREVMTVEFPHASEPERAKTDFLWRIFSTIGVDHVVTPEARKVLENAPPANREASNPRPFEVITMAGHDTDPHWWLRAEGVDPEASPNAELLAQTDQANDQLGLNVQATINGDPNDAASRLGTLWRSAQDAASAGAAPNVVQYAKDTVARGCTRLARDVDALGERSDLLRTVGDLVEPLLVDLSPSITDEAEVEDESSLISTRGVRVDGAEAAMSLCKVNSATAARFRASLVRLARDPHPAVRLAIASRLAMLWNTARDFMWQLAEYYGDAEPNLRVLRFFAAFLTNVLHADPARVETLVFAMLTRVHGSSQQAGDELIEAIGSLMVILWVTHERTRAQATLEEWLSDPARHESEIGHAIQSIRDGLVVGYGSQDSKDAAIRTRCQQFAARVVEVTAVGLQRYFDLSLDAQTGEQSESATKLAKLLDETCNEFYFASGAFRDSRENEEPLRDNALKAEFLRDNYNTLHRIGDVGTPSTIFHLIEMLGYLVPADPARVFDLTAHALLTAGRKQGFQFESLGAERFVQVVGLFLADHREIFENDTRRDQLVACLEVFVDIGWPAARRLLYRLPELLQ